MGTFLVGLIFLYVDIQYGAVSLLPAFVGYLLLLGKMRAFSDYQSFEQGCPVAVVGAAGGGIGWLLSLFGLAPQGVAAFLLALVSLTVRALTTYRLTRGMEELERATGLDMESDKLMTAWALLLIPDVGKLFFLVPQWGWVSNLFYGAGLIFYLIRFTGTYGVWQREKERGVCS